MIAHLLTVAVFAAGGPASGHHKPVPIEYAGITVSRAGPTGRELASSQIGNITLRVRPGEYRVSAFLEGDHPCRTRFLRITRRTRERRVNLFCAVTRRP